MGFYIQDVYWEAVDDLPEKAQNEYFGALVRLFFLGEAGEPSNKEARRAFKLSRDRVNGSRKCKAAADARWDASHDATDDAMHDASHDAEGHARRDAEEHAPLNKRESESENKRETKPISSKRDPVSRNPPSFDEAESYRIQAGLIHTDTKAFLAYYEANGWVQGKGKPIKDWKAAMRGWDRRQASWAKERRGDADHGEYADLI